MLFLNGTLYVVDSANDTVLAYNGTGGVVAKADAQWDTTDDESPVAGMQLFALSTAVVNGQSVILISDEEQNRVAAFDADGLYLFSLRLARPPSDDPTVQLAIGQVAMSPLAEFDFDAGAHELTLSGTMVAGWFEQQSGIGGFHSGAMVFPGTTTFDWDGAEFGATPERILDGKEENPVAPDPRTIFGVTFDSAGNLYVLDAWSERLHVYDPSFTRVFTLGTPIAGGGTSEFFEPLGLAYWPDANGGRLFISDTYNSRIQVYRPIDTPSSAPGIDTLQLVSSIKGFVPSVPRASLFAIAVDPSSGSIAVSDFADWDDGGHPRAIVLQQPNLAAFDLQALDANGAVLQSVCAGADYQIRFSLTVPPGRNPVNNVVPQLFINGVLSSAAAVAADDYDSPLTIGVGEVATFTYTLTADTELEDIDVVASATGDTPDILGRAEVIFLADCEGETDPSTITATPNLPSQVSGWTPVLQGQDYSVTLAAEDEDFIAEHRIPHRRREPQRRRADPGRV